MDALRLLRSVEENGKLLRNNQLGKMGLGSSPQPPQRKDHSPKRFSAVSGSDNSAAAADFETKDMSGDLEDDILSIVDEPYSKNINEHKQQILSSGMLKQLLLGGNNQRKSGTNADMITNMEFPEVPSQFLTVTESESDDYSTNSPPGGPGLRWQNMSRESRQSWDRDSTYDTEKQDFEYQSSSIMMPNSMHIMDNNSSMDTALDIHSINSVDSKDSNVRKMRKQLNERDMIQKRLEDKKSTLSRDISSYAASIEDNIHKAVEFLPIELLIKHGKFELVKERALGRMWELLCKMRINLLKMATKQWLLFVSSSNESVKLAAGAILVRIGRGYLGRKRYKKLWKSKTEKLRKAGRMVAVKSLGTGIVIIQAATRRYLARQRVKPIIKQSRASAFIAMFFKSKMMIKVAQRAIIKRKKENILATLIQKTYRAKLGRKIYREKVKDHKHKILQKKYETPEATFKYYFEQNGAASKLQFWFRNMPWYVKSKWNRKWLEYYKGRKLIWEDSSKMAGGGNKRKKKKKKKSYGTSKDQEYAMMAAKRMSDQDKRTDIADALNHVVRGFLGRRRISYIRKEMFRIWERKKKSATMIQKNLRRILVVKRLPHLGTRIRSSQIKLRKWRHSDNYRLFLEHETKRKLAIINEVNSRSLNTARSRPGSEAKGRPNSSPSEKMEAKSREKKSIENIQNKMAMAIDKNLVQRQMEDVVSTSSDTLTITYLRTRRNAIDVGTNFGIEKAKVVEKMNKAAYCISRSYRASNSRAKFRDFMANKQEVYATRLQRWGKFYTLRRRIIRFHNLIVNELGLWERILLRRSSASRIQRRYRVHASMMWLRNFKKERKIGILQLQRFFRRRIKADTNRKVKLNYFRFLLETRNAGLQQHDKSRIYCHIDHLWEGAAKTRSIQVPHDLQKYFSASSSGGMLESTRFAKQLTSIAKSTDVFRVKENEMPLNDVDNVVDVDEEKNNIIGKALDAKIVENMFLKCKAISDKRIDYGHFLDLLFNLAAIRFLGLDQAHLPNGEIMGELREKVNAVHTKPGSAGNGGLTDTERKYEYKNLINDGEITAEHVNIVNATDAFVYGRLIGRPALISKFVMSFISHTAEYKKGTSSLGSKSSYRLAEMNVSNAVDVLQIWALNRLAINRILSEWKILAARKIFRMRQFAATRINNLIRTYLGNISIMKTAQSVYSKFIDAESGAIYWFNPRTQASFWIKPILLGSKDCGNPVTMPLPDEQFIVSCSLCDPDDDPKPATLFCDECNDVFCVDCHDISHKSQQKRDHLKILLTLCVQCDFQAGTRLCLQCKDVFCDNCYKTVHRKGRLKLHIFDSITAQCTVCNDRAAQWTRNENDGSGGDKDYCIPCYRVNFGISEGQEIQALNVMTEIENEAIVTRYKFQGQSVRDFRGAREDAEKKKAIADAFAIRKAELFDLKMNRSATIIQRIYRGNTCRKQILQFLLDRRDFYVLREKHSYLRGNPIDKFMKFWGVSPILRSDTTLERVLKNYPTHMHEILSECINNKWKEAINLQREQEDHLLKFGNPSIIMTLYAKINAVRSTQKYQDAETKLTKKIAELEFKKLAYREARARNDTTKAQIKDLQSSAEETAVQVESARKEKIATEEEMQLSNKRVIDFVGPRGLHTLISNRRKNGIQMPFTVHLHKGSRVAEVIWAEKPDELVNEDFDNDDNDDNINPSAPGKDSHGVSKSKENLNVESHIPDVRVDRKSAQMELVARLKEESENLATIEKLRKPVLDANGDLLLDDYGSAVDGYGNYLQLDENGNAIMPDLIPEIIVDPSIENPKYGTWVNYIGEYDVLLIDSVTFQVIPKEEFIVDMKDDVSSNEKDKNADEDQDDDDDNDEDGNDDDSNDEDSVASEINEDDVDYQDKRHKLIDIQIVDRKFTDDYICLDRPWVLDDAEYISVSKVVPSIFYIKPIQKLAKLGITNYIPQKIVAVSAINLHYIGQCNSYMSNLFDKESDTGEWFRNNKRNMDRRKNNILKYSRSVVDFNYDFTMRRNFWKSVLKKSKSAMKIYRRMKNRAQAIAGDENAGIDFDTWNDSNEKVPISIWVEEENKKDVKIGEIIMDLKAPIIVMRQYIYRNNEMREMLNSEYHGENFLFFVVKENLDYDESNPNGLDSVEDWLLERDKEKMTYTSDFAPFKMDNKTMEGMNRCTVRMDQENLDVFPIQRLDKNGKPTTEEGEPMIE